MESGQEITVGVWDEMVAQLAEVREKRDQLQDSNNRVTIRCGELRAECDNLRVAVVDSNGQVASLREQVQEMRAQRDKVVAATESLRAEYLAVKEAANANSDNAAAMREKVVKYEEVIAALQGQIRTTRTDLREMTAQRDTLWQYRDEMQVSRDEARKRAEELQVQLSTWQVAHDTLKTERETMIRCRDAANVSSDQAANLREQRAELVRRFAVAIVQGIHASKRGQQTDTSYVWQLAAEMADSEPKMEE